MRNGLLGSIAALTAGAGLALAQGPRPGPASPVIPLPAGPTVAMSPLGPGAPAPVYEPLNNVPPTNPMGSPALDMFGPGGDPGWNGDARSCQRYWAQLDYLLWGVSHGPERWPLAMSGNILNGAVPSAPGALVLFGGSPFDFGLISGARATVGGLFPGSSRIGVEASGVILPKRSISTAAVSGPLGFPVLGTPFINDLTGTIESLNGASPANPGSIAASATTMMWATELDLFANFYRGPYFTWNCITGFKFFSLAEGFVMQQNRTIGSAGQTFEGNALPIGAQTVVNDTFNTTNRFYGWEMGFDFESRWRCWAFNLGLHAAIGNMRSSVDISGFSQSTTTGPPPANIPIVTQVPGGLLSQLTNIGRRIDNEFAVVPEVLAQVSYQITPYARFGIGYTYLYANNVARPGSQIDSRVNPTLVPTRPEFGLALGANRPMQLFNRSDYWAQGLNWSLSIIY